MIKGMSLEEMNEKRIYVVLPATVEVRNHRIVPQPYGRQIAQACHVVSKLRMEYVVKHLKARPIHVNLWIEPATTIILQARDQKEMMHTFSLLTEKVNQPTLFADENPDVYGDIKPITAMAVVATPKQVLGILDYLPLWGAA